MIKINIEVDGKRIRKTGYKWKKPKKKEFRLVDKFIKEFYKDIKKEKNSQKSPTFSLKTFIYPLFYTYNRL